MSALLTPPKPATMRILNPISPRRKTTMQMAARLTDLDGKTIGLLSNGKPASSEVLEGIRRVLAARYKDVQFDYRRKQHASVGAAFIPSVLDRWDGAVVAIGD